MTVTEAAVSKFAVDRNYAIVLPLLVKISGGSDRIAQVKSDENMATKMRNAVCNALEADLDALEADLAQLNEYAHNLIGVPVQMSAGGP